MKDVTAAPRIIEASGERWLLAGIVAVVTAAGALAGLYGGADASAILEPHPTYPFFADFLMHYWPAGRQAWQQGGPTAGFQYPPLAVVGFMPFGAVASRESATVLWALTLGISAGALAAAPLPSGAASRRLLALLLVTSVPVWHSIRWGQISLPLTALALWGSLARRGGAGNWLLAASIGLKGYPVVLLGPLGLTRRGRMRAAMVLLASAVLGLGLPAVVLGWTGMLAWLDAAARVLADAESWMALNSNAQYLPHVAARLVGGPWWLWGLASVGLALFSLARAAREVQSHRVERGMAVAWLAVALVVPPSWPHYFVFMPWVLAVLYECRAIAPAWARAAWTSAAVLSSLFGLVVAGDWKVYAHLGLLALANLLALMAVLDSSPAHSSGSDEPVRSTYGMK